MLDATGALPACPRSALLQAACAARLHVLECSGAYPDVEPLPAQVVGAPGALQQQMQMQQQQQQYPPARPGQVNMRWV